MSVCVACLLKRISPICHFLIVYTAGVFYLLLGGCATWQAPAPIDDTALRARAVSATLQDVRLSATVLSAEDSRQMLGADVNSTR